MKIDLQPLNGSLPEEGRRCILVTSWHGFGRMIWCAYRKGNTWFQHSAYYGIGELCLRVVGEPVEVCEVPYEANDIQIAEYMEAWKGANVPVL